MRSSIQIVLMLLLAGAAAAQKTGQALTPAEIHGQVRMDNRAAPAGILVLLDMAPNRDTAPASTGELGRTVTDSSGKFRFDHLETLSRAGGTKLFAVSIRYPGYKDTFQVVDLSFSSRGYSNLELKRDTSKDMPNTPPPGAGNTISARQPASSEAQQALSKGQDLLFTKHEAKNSLEYFQKVVKIDPQYGPGYVLLGTAYMQSGDWAAAQAAFEKGMAIDPANAAAFLGVGAALNEQHKYDQARSPLRHSLELNPDSAEAHFELARCYWALNDWQDAEGHVRKAIELNKDYADPHVLMGNIYLRHRDANSALSEFKESLRLNPEGPQAGSIRDIIEKIEKALAQR
ncbi:MAG: hypothetical protein DMG65_10315 [Candidatus Angelobacter sp. Gp1-AA117]|nr:MAG: hypothetical protein DMG65_10315 [Candidatus Angelobacter sp. Gp1-AA117]